MIRATFLLILLAGACQATASGTGDGAVSDHVVVPTGHPFISLADYDAVDRSSSAFTTLKAAVDDVVRVTSALPAGATYDDLSQALSSNHYGYSCADSIVMFHLARDAKYLQQAITMVDLFVQSENSLIASGKKPSIAGDSFLDVGPDLEQLALAYDYGYDLLSAGQRTAWKTYADSAVHNLWNHDSAAWGSVDGTWTGWATDDPGDNYYYSFLKATELWALASQSDEWKTFLEGTKFPQLEAYFGGLTGGGSREGTGYGTALGALFSDYRYWRSSTGENLAAKSSHAADTIDYWVHATVPTLEYYASIGDQARSSMTTMFDYQRVLMLEAVNLANATPQAARGAWWLANVPVTDGGSGWVFGKVRYNFDFRFDLLASKQAATAPTALTYNAGGAGALFSRSAWDQDASWISTIAGIYDQSHAHQEQGAFEFFKSGWLSATTNLLSGSGLHQETGAQNVVRFEDGGKIVPQSLGTASMTFSDSPDVLTVTEDLAPLYAGTGVTSWTRVLSYTRSTHSVAVHDTCAVRDGVKPIFQVQLPISTAPKVSGATITAGALTITQTQPAVGDGNQPVVVHMPSVDPDFKDGYRVDLTGAGCEFQVTLQAN